MLFFYIGIIDLGDKMNIKDYIIEVKDFPKKGVNFKDITLLLKEPKVFKYSINQFEKCLKNIEFDYFVGLDARGFLLGTPLAMQMNKGFIPVRKPGKLPRKIIKQELLTEYSKTSVSIHVEDLKKGDKVVIIDDLLATGGTIESTISLLQKMKIEIVHILFLIELDYLHGRNHIGNYPITSLINYKDE